jgi:hypothetical protein
MTATQRGSSDGELFRKEKVTANPQQCGLLLREMFERLLRPG